MAETTADNNSSDSSDDNKKSLVGDLTQVITNPNDDPLIGTTIGKFTIKARLGQGGMGHVYLAWDGSLDREVALKFLPEYLTQDVTAVERLVREAKAAAKLEHSNIVSILDIGEEAGRHFITMQYVQGGTLDERLEDGPLSVDESLRILREAASGLLAAHDQGIIHRDVKPENIMIDKYDTVKISDFGLAVTTKNTARLTLEGQILGTPYIMSPEQCDGKEVDIRTDIYSLGITLYRMVTGKWPHDADTAVAIILKHLQNDIPDPRTYNKDIPPYIINLINKMTAKLPDDRYQTMAELLQDLQQLSDTNISQAETLKAKEQKSPVLIRSILIVLLLCTAGYAAYLKLNENKPSNNTVLIEDKPGKKHIVSHDEAISDCLKQIDNVGRNLSNSKWVESNSSTNILLQLDEYKKNLEALKNLDPTNKKIDDREAAYDSFQRSLVTKIANNVIATIEQQSSIDKSIAYIKSRDSRVLEISRISEHVFAKYTTKINTLLNAEDSASHMMCLELINSLWSFNVPYETKKNLIEHEKKLRKIQLPDSTDLNRKRRGYIYQKSKYARELVTGNLDVNNAILLFESSVAEAEFLKQTSPDFMTPQYYSELKRDLEHWKKYRRLRDDFYKSLENPKNFVYNDITASYEGARIIHAHWKRFHATQEVELAFKKLEHKEAIDEGRRAEEEKKFLRAYNAYIQALKIKPQDVTAANAKERIEKELKNQYENLVQPLIQEAELEINNGHLSEAQRILDNAEEIAESAKDKVSISNLRKRLNNIVNVINQANVKLKEKKWDDAINLLKPMVEKHPFPKAMYSISMAYKSIAEDHAQGKNWSLAYKNMQMAISYQKGNADLIEAESKIKTSWVNQTLDTITNTEMNVDKAIKAGDFDLASKLLMDFKLESEVLKQSKEIKSLMDNLSKLRMELGDYDDWVKKIIQAKKENKWNDVTQYLIEAEKIGGKWPSFKEFKKNTLYDKSMYIIESTQEVNESKLQAYWTAWNYRSLSNEATIKEKLIKFRVLYAETVIKDISQKNSTFNDLLKQSKFQDCQTLLNNHDVRFKSIITDHNKEPKIKLSETFHNAQKTWQLFGIELKKIIAQKNKKDEFLKKYTDFMKLANDAKKNNELQKCIDNLKNALAFANEAQAKSIRSQINDIQLKIDDIKRKEEEFKKDKLRRENIIKLIADIQAKEKSENWSEALRLIDQFIKTSKKEDQLLLPQDDTRKNIVNWKSLMNSRIEDKTAFDSILKECKELDNKKATDKLKRFIRLNQGNYYVTNKNVHKHIDTLNNSIKNALNVYTKTTLESIKKLNQEKKQIEAKNLLKEALTKYPNEEVFHKALITQLQLNRVRFKGGAFTAGSDKGEGVADNEQPPYVMTVNAFELSKFEVTNIEWLYFLKAKHLKESDYWKDGEAYALKNPLKPIVGVSYKAALQFAEYSGARLPTEFEWEYAARGGKSEAKRWPWGNTEDDKNLNISGKYTNVDSHDQGKSENGIYHMAGNVAEWTSSPYLSYPSKGIFGKNKPKPIIENAHTIRGGSTFDKLAKCRTTAREGKELDSQKLSGIGLRLCWDIK